ncbi:MAG TPA: deoxyribose-phosphate aldolase [Kineosporiaceae bacterium]|nr:deoxyribose-phosphate aldolase [Kineosporiaceae bacterium]
MSPISIARGTVAKLIDHTLLKPEATAADVATLCAQAAELGVFSVCISPSRLPLAVGILEPGFAVATVCGFPSGAHPATVKATEAAVSVANGADEVDMVINLGLVKEGDWDGVTAEITAVRAAVPAPGLVKVIIESAVLTDDEIVAACQASERAGADYVKTSTGYHPAGGASVHAVTLMAATVGGRLGIKASGGIRTTESAVELLEAGATRLGLSGSKAILDGLTG